MKILPLTPIQYSAVKNNQSPVKNPIQATETTGSVGIMFGYRDYNINFTGRTPEDFYAQDFNRENMPRTMKDYLDYDYVERQHIPPEQMMKEVFKFIELADNLEDVKNIYPKEDLFRNLHENHIKSRKGILSEIKVARELSDTPLLKDGSDDFGLYLLKKIYMEGKTLKEISKDFLEKDISEEYKGFITEPVQYSTLSAYGIEYPKLPFWKSFIATREEYKKFFVTLPKDEYVPGVNAGDKTSKHHSSIKSADKTPEHEKEVKRKYNIKSHRKREIANDLIDKKPTDMETVTKTVVKRFGKGDPEASFIVKYMSPIMTVAAERIHLSEEMKAFAENEQVNGKSSNEKTMFGRFWKQNPELLKNFSYSITDTIEMFEDIYGAGGNIGINSDLVPVTKNSTNQKIIDFVSPEFLDLLTYTQEIEPKRNQKYEKHDELQKQWEEHFVERYGNPESVTEEVQAENGENLIDEFEGLSPEQILEIEAARNNAKVYTFINDKGQKIHITANLDEVLSDELKSITRFMPTKYAQLAIRELTKEGVISDKFKLTLLVSKTGQVLDDPRLYSPEDYKKEYMEAETLFRIKHRKEEAAARTAMADTIVTLGHADVIDPIIYKFSATGYKHLIEKTPGITSKQAEDILKEAKPQFDKLYDEYCRPLSKAEMNKVEMQLIDVLLHYDTSKTILTDNDSKAMINMFKDMLKYKTKRQAFKTFLDGALEKYPYSRSILNKNLTKAHRQAKCEELMETIQYLFLMTAEDYTYLMTLLNKETYDRYKDGLTPEIRSHFDTIISRMDFTERRLFMASDEELKQIAAMD
ncbi:hypothetical protein IKR55_01165 [bacterium]|nr:hypothetical protein [bacterium]